MRPEKQFLVEETGAYFDRTDYVFLTNYLGTTVDDTAELRGRLAKHGAEFHVVKNKILNVAARQRSIPDLSEYLSGQTAIVIGGKDMPGVVKTLQKFFKDKEKVEVKGGVLGKSVIGAEDVGKLADMPSIETLQAQLLGLLNQPASQFVRLLNTPGQQFVTALNGVGQNFLNVLNQRKMKMESSEAA